MTTPTTAPMTSDLANNVWSRNCEFCFEHYEDNAVVVTLWNSRDEVVWSGSTGWYEEDRIIDVIRRARENAELRRIEYGS